MMMMAAGGYLGWSKLELDQLYQHLLTGRSMRHHQPEASFTGNGKETYRRSLHLSLSLSLLDFRVWYFLSTWSS